MMKISLLVDEVLVSGAEVVVYEEVCWVVGEVEAGDEAEAEAEDGLEEGFNTNTYETYYVQGARSAAIDK